MGVRGRWFRFNLVGVLGFALQTATLFVLVRWASLEPAIAVTVAVLATVSHNFFWHEHFTWPARPREARFQRWLSFQCSNGILSVAGNVVVTTMVTRATGLPLVSANVIAVAIVSLANYWVSDRLVFRRECRFLTD